MASRALRSGHEASAVALSGLESAQGAFANNRESAQLKSDQLESAIYRMTKKPKRVPKSLPDTSTGLSESTQGHRGRQVPCRRLFAT